jgi:5'-3' exonuclease
MIALIDGDILAYQAAAIAEKATDWGDGLWTLHAEEAEAWNAFQTALSNTLDSVGTSTFILAFSDKKNFRKDVLPTYKSNRIGVRKPMLLGFIRSAAEDRYVCETMEGLEGDDVLGIIATKEPKGDYVICTIDKDLKTIPCKHYNFGTQEFFETDEATADKWHMLQTLTGDTTDGYKGCPSIGIKTAEKILQDVPPEQMWQAVVDAYAKAGLGEEEALVQARVARILRASDYNFNTKEVILWNPTA